jgi:hypothetical protein
MANITYANPFGSYVEGQSRGLEDAVRAGTAARQFRDSDVNADFMKWYAPLRREEATTGLARSQAETGQTQLALNQGLFKNYTGVAGLGPGAEEPLLNHLRNVYGIDPSKLRYEDYNDFLRRSGGASGDYPFQFVADPYAIQAGGAGSRRLLPAEISGVQGQQHIPEFNAFNDATGHIPGFGAPSPNTQPSPTMPPQQGINLNAPPQQHAPQMQQPKSIWADEYNPAPANGGGINLGRTNPRVNSVTGGF